jgi:hypothetical protein
MRDDTEGMIFSGDWESGRGGIGEEMSGDYRGKRGSNSRSTKYKKQNKKCPVYYVIYQI